MKTIYKYLTITSLFTLMAVLLGACNEDSVSTDMDALRKVDPPTVTSFSPSSGYMGEELYISGTNLGSIDSIWVGGVKIVVKNRVSQELLIAEITGNAKTGTIKVQNKAGIAASTDSFTVQYYAPALNAGGYPTAATVTAPVLLQGTNLQAVTAVYFGTVKATVTTRLNTEMMVVVPPIPMPEGDNVDILLEYNTASGTATTGTTGAPVHIDRVQPVFTSVPSKGNAGSLVTVFGENLSVIETVILDTAGMPEPLVIPVTTASRNSFSFMLPDTVAFEIHDNTFVNLQATCYQTETAVLKNSFAVTIPGRETVYYWENILLGCQKATVDQAFFYALGGEALTPCDYATRKNDIDFFFSWSGGRVQLNNPSSSTSQLKNFKCNGTALPSEAGVRDIKYKVLDPANATQNDIIELVKTKSIVKITPELIAPLGVPGTNNPTSYPPGSGSTSQYKEGSVIFFQVFEGSPATPNPDKCGFIEVTKMNFIEAAANDYSASTVMINVYYKK